MAGEDFTYCIFNVLRGEARPSERPENNASSLEELKCFLFPPLAVKGKTVTVIS